jgi:charged multivesicular body protein 6
MLGGKITNQDEEEVEDELAAMQAEVLGERRELPRVPDAQLPTRQGEGEARPELVEQPERRLVPAS